MTDRELRELKRRWRPERCNIERVVGCFVNENKEIIARINQSLALCDDAVKERLLGVLKKAMSGSLGIQLSEMDFSTRQVSEGEEHKLLMSLRSTRLRDGEVLERFYTKVKDAVKLEGNFVILLANDVYDVRTRHSDGELGESNESFSYLVCAVCPLKDAPDALTFRESDSLFHTAGASGILASPELGFTFPAFDNRTTNIYGAVYYAKSRSESYGDFTRAVFNSEPPMPQKAQRTAFGESLSAALADECDMSTVKAVQSVLCEMIESHKESRDPEPLTLTKEGLKSVLENCGASEEVREKFGEKMDASFGTGASVTPKNIIATNSFEVKMPEVKITISPEFRDLISTREINGESYITIKVSGPVEINGIPVAVKRKSDDDSE
jgi:vacuolar-type H+-ATPase subunit E/Vma4